MKFELDGRNGKYVWNSEGLFQPKAKFASTYLGSNEQTGSKVVVKRFFQAQEKSEIEFHRIKREAELHAKFPDLFGNAELLEQGGNYYLIREFFEGIDLKSTHFHKAATQKIDSTFWIKIGIAICEQLELLHHKGIYHCDVKPSNIIVEFDGINPRVRLIDFGSAYESGMNYKVPFSFVYSPPELVLGLNELIGPATDLYALAIVLYEKITGRPHIFNQNAGILIQLQLTQDLKAHNKLRPEVYETLKKATNKGMIAKPPSMYKREEIAEIVSEGIQKRYLTAGDFKSVLAEMLELPAEGLLKRLKRLI
jgi:serine/threonine protein kinase